MVATAMTQDILIGAQARLDFLLSLIDPNRVDPNAPVSRLNLREGVRTGLRFREYVTEALRLSWRDAFENRVDDYNGTGNTLLVVIDLGLKALRAVGRSLDAAGAGGRLDEVDPHFEEEVAKFRETIPALEFARADFVARWPWCGEARLRESIAADKRGERGRPAGEAFRELRSLLPGTGHPSD
jgi:hypothetical protein